MVEYDELLRTVALHESLVGACQKELLTFKRLLYIFDRGGSLEELLASALRLVLELMGMEAGSVYLTVDNGLEAEPRAEETSVAITQGGLREFYRTSKSIGQAMESNRVQWCCDTREVPHPTGAGFLRSYLVAPLVFRGRSVGVMGLMAAQPRSYALQDLHLVTTMAGQLGMTLENDRLDRRERELGERLVQAQKLSALGQLVSTVAHEVNNPLTAVVGFAELLAAAENLDPSVRETLEIICQEARRASQVLVNMLDFSRKRAPARVLVDLNAVIASCHRVLAHDLELHAIDSRWELSANLPCIKADATQIQQVFMNLLGNARQAMHAARGSGRLTIRTWEEGGAVFARVSDDGPGIPSDLLARLFEPFTTSKAEGQGTGLGLSICKAIIRQHGGTIRVDSEPGQGATFTIRLPAARGVAERTVPPSPTNTAASPQQRRRCRILVVDDQPSVRNFVIRVLQDGGHQVVGVGDARSALENLERERFDIVIADVLMPGMSGLEMYDMLRLRADRPSPLFLFISGEGLGSEARRFAEGENLPLLPKPFTPMSLRDAVASLLEALPAA